MRRRRRRRKSGERGKGLSWPEHLEGIEDTS
jgi:hypothetical protein